MKLPDAVIPVLEEVVRSPLLPRGLPIEIWRSTDHRNWIDAFTELSRLLFDSDIAEETIPHAYAQVAYLFDWEAQCQFSGWFAFSNRADTIDRVIQSYTEVGLSGEAEALRAANQAWIASGGDLDVTNEAYNRHAHAYSVDLDRLEHLVCYFIDNAERLFYVSGAET